MPLRAGAAYRVINCEIGDDLRGQLRRRRCERIRDDLEANLLYLTDGGEQVLLASLDLCMLLDAQYVGEVRGAIAKATAVPARNVLLATTHTHTGPGLERFLHDEPPNTRYAARLKDWLVDAAREAVSRAQLARAGSGTGRAHIGFNRRLCWADGTHTMYGDASRPDFAGLEGPDDPTHTVLAVRDAQDRPIALVHNNCCHATCVELATYASADFPGEARAALRRALGSATPVLYLQGASGDVSPWNMLAGRTPRDNERRAREMGSLLAGETLRLMPLMTFTEDVTLRHAYEDLQVAVRLPSPQEVKAAEQLEAAGETGTDRWNYVLQVDGALRLQRAFKDHPVDTVPVHGVRVGELAIATNPCEMYCQFGLDIRRRSPARHTMLSQLTDGCGGYCPTVHGVIGGGYSSDPTYWCRLEAAAGYRLVDASARLLHRLWKD